jgi:Integrase core domain
MDLKSLYYDPRTGLSSLASFYHRAKEHGFTRPQVADFLSRQELFQRNKDRTERHYFPIWGLPDSYQTDLLDMGVRHYKEYRYVLNIIEINTRKAYAYALKSKAETPDVFITWMKLIKPKVIQADKGTEFRNNKIQKFCKTHGIDLRFIDPKNKTDQGKIERFNGTLRRLITLYMMAYKTDDWVKALPTLLENYNSRFHTALGTSPDKADETTVNAKNRRQFNEAQQYFQRFGIGDRVRRLIKKANLFVKGRNEWTKEVYTIDQIKWHEFHLKGHGWVKSWEVQLVPDETETFQPPEPEEPQVPIAVKQKRAKSTRALNKEGIKAFNNAGEKEVPTTQKRQSKTKEIYVAKPSNLKELKAQREAEQAKVKRQGERVSQYVQKYVQGKWIRGKVLPDLRVKYLDGTTGTYSRQLIKDKVIYKFPLDTPDKRVFPALRPQLDALT